MNPEHGWTVVTSGKGLNKYFYQLPKLGILIDLSEYRHHGLTDWCYDIHSSNGLIARMSKMNAKKQQYTSLRACMSEAKNKVIEHVMKCLAEFKEELCVCEHIKARHSHPEDESVPLEMAPIEGYEWCKDCLCQKFVVKSTNTEEIKAAE